MWGFRDVNPQAAQWRFGGAAYDANHTRIIDVVWDRQPTQEEMLGRYTPTKEPNPDRFNTDELAQLGMIR